MTKKKASGVRQRKVETVATASDADFVLRRAGGEYGGELIAESSRATKKPAVTGKPPRDGGGGRSCSQEWGRRRDSDLIDVSADVKSLPAHSIMSPQLGNYLAACRVYSVEPDPGAAMVFDNLRRTSHLAIDPAHFHPLGMLPLCEVLKDDRTIRSLDLSGCPIGSNGCYVLQALLERNSTLESLELRYCGIDFRGAVALAKVIKGHPSMRCLNMRGNDIGEPGAGALVAMVQQNPRIVELDVSNNCVGTVAVERLCRAVRSSPNLTIELGGNYVREEVLNAITHGVGLIAFSVAGWILVSYARQVSTAYYVSAQIYAWSLVFMYASSTSCHSTFMLPITGAVCRAFDHCSIYLLIAGTFTPICAVTLGHTWSGIIALSVVWAIALVGITVTLAESTAGAGAKGGRWTVWLALGQGWCGLLISRQAYACLPFHGSLLIGIGGIVYSIGVVFFIKGETRAIYHVWWHVFVIIASALHFAAIFGFVGDICEIEMF